MDRRRVSLREESNQLSHPMELREVFPFFILLTLVVSAVYFWAIWSMPELRSPGKLIPLTLMMVVHIALHWASIGLQRSGGFLLGKIGNTVLYLIMQAGLVFAIGVISRHQGLLFGLHLPLIGETIGFAGTVRGGVALTAGYSSLAVINLGLIWGWESVPGVLLFYVPMVAFILIYVVLYGRQAAARRQSQELLLRLESAYAELERYAARVEELTLAEERQRMARELHDTLAQGLAGLILQLEAVDSHLARQRKEEAQTIVEQAMERARSTLSEARQAIADLRATNGHQPDLRTAIEDAIRRFSDATGIDCLIHLDPLAQLPHEIAEHVLRAVSEGLTNVARHARANRVELSIRIDNRHLELVLKDDGVGFRLQEAEREQDHFGLVGLRERARLARGTLSIGSSPGKGTTLTMRLPLEGWKGS